MESIYIYGHSFSLVFITTRALSTNESLDSVYPITSHNNEDNDNTPLIFYINIIHRFFRVIVIIVSECNLSDMGNPPIPALARYYDIAKPFYVTLTQPDIFSLLLHYCVEIAFMTE